MTSQRMLRINEMLKREIGSLCEREIPADSRMLLTVTHVETSPDLRHAKVYISVFGEEDQWDRTFELLRSKRAEFQKCLARRTRLKYTPVLEFERDKTLAQADRIFKIIDELELDDDEPEGPPK